MWGFQFTSSWGFCRESGLNQIISYKTFVNIVLLTILSQSVLGNITHAEGVLDLRTRQVSVGESIPLKENWQFYWNMFLDPQNLDRKFQGLTIEHQFWNKHKIDGKSIPAIGYGTYQLQVLLNSEDVGHQLALYIRENNTASRFFINGRAIGEVGKPGKDLENSTGSWQPTVLGFEAISDTLDILVHVSNYEFRNGGLGRPVLLGSLSTLEKQKQGQVLRDIFFIGIYFALGLYHLGIVILRPKDLPSRWLSIVFLLWISRLLFAGNYTILMLVSSIPLSVLMRIEYLSLYGLFVSTLLYFSYVYQAYLIPRTITGVKTVGAVFILTVMIPDSIIVSTIGGIFLILIPLLAIFPFIALIRAARDGNTEARTTMLVAILLFLGVLNDILYTLDIIHSQFVVPYAFLAFIIGQAFIIARSHTNAYSESIRQSREKEVLLNEVHHRVRNNLNVVVSLLRLEARKERDPENAIDALHESVRRIQAMTLVHDRLYNSGNFASIELKPYIQTLITEISRTLSITHINFSLNVEQLNLDLNRAIPCGLILNELLTNTVKYAYSSGESGEVNIALSADEKTINLIVSDNGPGIPEAIQSDKRSLGLHIVSMLTEQLDGQLKIENRNGAHVTVSFPQQTIY